MDRKSHCACLESTVWRNRRLVRVLRLCLRRPRTKAIRFWPGVIGRSSLPTWSARRRSCRRWSTRSRVIASPMPISSPALAAWARRPPHASWPRRSTACAARRPHLATSARSARASPRARIVERLRQVVAGEAREADDEALELIARRAGGSMRDAQSLLDQLLAFGGDRLTTDLVHQLLGTAPDERVIALASAVLEHDAAGALELLGKAADEGLQLGELLEQLLDYWRDLMVANSAGGHYPHLNLPVRYHETLASQAAASN